MAGQQGGRVDWGSHMARHGLGIQDSTRSVYPAIGLNIAHLHWRQDMGEEFWQVDHSK